MMHRNRSVNVHQFAMVPRADIPRSRFNVQHGHKTTFDAGYLVPVFVDEVLPGDTYRVNMTAFVRLATPLFPVMDNLYLETFFFFVPNRLVWDNWVKFMGEQKSPGDSTSYVIPKVTSLAGGFEVGSIYDHMGLPTVGQVDPAGQVTVSALPLRAYALIYDEWFRDENLNSSFFGTVGLTKGDGPDSVGNYAMIRRGKRHDYFTSCLPWPQKGDSVALPLGIAAPVRAGIQQHTSGPWPVGVTYTRLDGTQPNIGAMGLNGTIGPGINWLSSTDSTTPVAGGAVVYPTNLYADLSQATAATINQLRQAFQIQKLLERDARGGTRYTEIVRAHFGVISPDARLQRPEYLGGGRTPIVVTPIAQTSATDESGSSTPLGNLAAFGTGLGRHHGFSQSFTEHGYIIGIMSVRADLTYQQGLRKLWSRNTRYDFYFPAFAMLGEQAVLSKEIYCNGTAADNDVFGYQERWAEYRYFPSMVTGLFRSTSAGTLDAWHLAQRFSSRPTLGATFILENPPLERVLAVGAEANGAQFIFDGFFDMQVARPMPMYSVPGLIDHF